MSKTVHVIVGVDTGNTVGIACISLKGELLLSGHMKNADLGWIVSSVNSAGTPIMVATDKKVAGASVRKVSASLGAKVFTPPADLTIDAKKKVASICNIINPHERDAYAAAMKAYDAYLNKLNQAARLAAEKHADSDSIMAKVMLKYSIDEAISNRKSGRR